MKIIAPVLLLTILSGLSVSTIAHSPEMHKKANAEKPKCEGMHNMDHGNMDMNDPVMMAMMKQCESTTDDHHDEKHNKKDKKDKHSDDHGDHDMKKNHG